MAQSQSPFKFDHREMTVIFSLFIFTSLLMFTIGIVVGKSLAQTKSSDVAATETVAKTETGHESEAHVTSPHTPGTSVSTDSPTLDTKHAKPSHLESVTAEVTEPETPPAHPAPPTLSSSHEAPVAKKEPLKTHEKLDSSIEHSAPTAELELIPEKPRTGDVRATLADLADQDEVGKALNNPKVQALLESSPPTKMKAKKRKVASVAPSDIPPKSFPEGKYTVQVGSYPSQADATLRVDQLRKLGYPFAYLSTKELGEKKEPWYRVWLGYFADSETAKASGELLQQREEVKSYLVRKSDTKED